MMISLLSTDPGRYFAIILVVVVSIVLHELAHGYVAIKLGDRTPIETGHMTLNPLVHMGAMSLILLAVVGIAWGQMPVNPSRLRGKYGDLWVSAAGPAMNLLLAIAAVLTLGVLARAGAFAGESAVAQNGWLLLWQMSVTNIALMILNLIPIPPLDGSYMLGSLSPGYRRLMSGDTARGLVTAVMFAIFLGAGRYIFGAANYATEQGFMLVAGVG